MLKLQVETLSRDPHCISDCQVYIVQRKNCLIICNVYTGKIISLSETLDLKRLKDKV